MNFRRIACVAVAGAFFVTCCFLSFDLENTLEASANPINRQSTIIIDAGHGEHS